MTDAVVAEVTARAKAVWDGGNWDEVAGYIVEVGGRLLDRLEPLEGRDLLDVGAGNGSNVAIPAARRGARVVASDLTDQWFATGRRMAADAGVEIEWVRANCEELPFGDASFDVVASTFGHMFAPRHAVAAAELARVCRPGGVVATATWIPRSFVGEMFGLLAEYMPAPPDFVQPPPLWGVTDHVEAMFEPHGMHLEFAEETLQIDHDGDRDDYVTGFEANFGPMVAARAVLGERWAELDQRYRELVGRHDTGGPGRTRLRQDYLITLARKP